MPVVVLDLAYRVGSITVGFATGVEPFTDLGSIGTVHPDPGKVIFVDCNSVVSARRWCRARGQPVASNDVMATRRPVEERPNWPG